MKNCTLKISLKSDALIGSGEGGGAIIDTDIIVDDVGLPMIPGKRVKGCLREALCEVIDMFKLSGILSDIEFPLDIDAAFGRPGQEEPANLRFSNFYIEDNEQISNWLRYLSHRYKELISNDIVRDSFTSVRSQTAIGDNGVAMDESLRTIRLARKELSFSGAITVHDDSLLALLRLAVMNFRCMGTKRNRGLGEIECELLCDGKPLSAPEELEAVWKR